MDSVVPVELVERKIYLIRGHKVMLDSDLAELYEVRTKALIQAVKRNIGRFPLDFMFQLNNQEVITLRSQFVTSKSGKGGRRYIPYVFTEQGVAMLSSVLNSERAILVNIAIVRAFVKLREMLSTHKELAHKLKQLENKIEKHDEEIKVIFDAIRQLMIPPEPTKKKIGFIVREHSARYRRLSRKAV
ncbi:MAG: ORF6N domain-containing protein [Nitrospirae bacterium]|nr:ORF6N domain-containing protein [Nitrospirota bacterium]